MHHTVDHILKMPLLHALPEGVTPLPLGEAVLLRRDAPSAIEGTLYRPLMCLILQGAKDVTAGRHAVHCPAGHAIVVSHDLPVLSQITQATAEAPYMALVLPLDLGLLRSFYDQMPPVAEAPAPQAALVSQPAGDALVGAVGRLLALAEGGKDAALLGPIILREIHARLLLSPQGAVLRRFLHRDDPSNHLARAITMTRSSLDAPLSVTDLAETVGMSRSSFHAHFKAVIGQSPGQYQKDIRLLEARRMIRESRAAISAVAYDVGYESPAQFSRDYARKFGQPPRADRKGMIADPEGQSTLAAVAG